MAHVAAHSDEYGFAKVAPDYSCKRIAQSTDRDYVLHLMAPKEGFAPSTVALTERRSTLELLGSKSFGRRPRLRSPLAAFGVLHAPSASPVWSER